MNTALMDREESELLNTACWEKLGSADQYLVKQAVDQINEFTRTKMREDGFYRRIMPPLPLDNSQLDREIEHDMPIKIIDKEADSPAAISIPFAMMPQNLYIRGKRYKVTFSRITTPKFTKDTDELRTWIMDIRQVLSDNAIKDMLAEEDSKFVRTCNAACVGPGLVVATSGVVQHEVFSGGITRETYCESLKIMPGTPSNLEVHLVLINNITVKDLMKWSRNEMGGDVAQDIAKQGWSMQEFMGTKLLITIKKGLVQTGRAYHFADPSFIGKSYTLDDVTMYIRREAFMLEFFAYETLGGAIGFTSGIAIADWE